MGGNKRDKGLKKTHTHKQKDFHYNKILKKVRFVCVCVPLAWMSSKLEMWLLPAAAEAGMVELFVVPALGRRNPATPPEGRPVNRAAALGSVWAVLREGSGGAGSGGGSAISGGFSLLFRALLLLQGLALALPRVFFAGVF